MADELVRVCRPGGRIGMANWSANGLLQRLQAIMAAFAPTAPPGPSAMLWGSEDHCRALFGDRVSGITSTMRIHELCADSALAYVEFLSQHLGPLQAQLAPLDQDAQRHLMAAMAAEYERANRATDGTLVVHADYLELVAWVA